jgi:hypothetical protein
MYEVSTDGNSACIYCSYYVSTLLLLLLLLLPLFYIDFLTLLIFHEELNVNKGVDQMVKRHKLASQNALLFEDM